MYKIIFLFAMAIAAPVLAQNKASYFAVQQEKITPCAPGVVYIQFKVSSNVIQRITSKGAIAQSSGADTFQTVLSALGLRMILPFDAHAAKDSISRSFGIDRMYCLYYSNKSIDPHTALEMLVATGEIQCGSVRYLFPLSCQPPDDSLISQQYALTNMNVFNAWCTTTGDTSIVIADVDCAINIDHEDLKNEIKYNWGETGCGDVGITKCPDSSGFDKRFNRIDDDGDGDTDNYEGWDFVGDVNASSGAEFEPNNNPRPRENNASHGTLTAGCILATGNNGVGIAGVAYGCRLLAIKAAGSDFNNISAGYEGIHYASTHNARIINCSWVGEIASSDTAYANVFLEEAIALHALVVAAAGNGDTDNDVCLEYPADGPGVLSVGATDKNDKAADFSDYGHSVSVWAPGVNIESCDYPGDSSYSEQGQDGTSFSAPLVAGVAGLLWSINHDSLPEFIYNRIVSTCDNVVNPNDRADYWGRVNAGNALSADPSVVSSYGLNDAVSESSILFDVRPNPAQSVSTIYFELPESDNVRIVLCDAAGRTIETLIDKWLSAGAEEVVIDTRDLPDGIYYITLETSSGIRLTRAITVLK